MNLALDKNKKILFDEYGNLPPGVFESTINEIEEYYSFSPKRKILIKGLKKMLKALTDIGCKKFYLDGSFVTDKLEPGDFDACWESHNGIQWDILNEKYPELKMFSPPRNEQKRKYLGEAFISNHKTKTRTGDIVTFLDFFQVDREGRPKGIILIKL